MSRGRHCGAYVLYSTLPPTLILRLLRPWSKRTPLVRWSAGPLVRGVGRPLEDQAAAVKVEEPDGPPLAIEEGPPEVVRPSAPLAIAAGFAPIISVT